MKTVEMIKCTAYDALRNSFSYIKHDGVWCIFDETHNGLVSIEENEKPIGYEFKINAIQFVASKALAAGYWVESVQYMPR